MTTPPPRVRGGIQLGAVDVLVGATRLEATTALPLYYRIAEAIICALREDRLPTMTAFPSDGALGSRMGVARNTVAGARRYLRDRGHLTVVGDVSYLVRETPTHAQQPTCEIVRHGRPAAT